MSFDAAAGAAGLGNPGRQLIWHRTSAFVVCPLVTVATPAARHNAAPLS